MYKSIVSVCLLFVSTITISFAQTSENALDAQSEELLKSISDKYQNYVSSKIDLNLIIELPEVEEPETIAVKAWLKSDKFKIDLGDQLFISDNITLWNYMSEYNEVQVNHFEEADALFSPSQIFAVYDKNYIYRIKEEYTESSNAMKVVEMSPIDKTQDFFKIELIINETKKEIVSSKIFEKSGMRYTYQINSFIPNVELAEDFFSFDASKYNGIEVVDLR